MAGKLKLRMRNYGSANLLLAFAVFLVMLLLFLRMVIFVAGSGHHRF
jgi:hypothetical protein